MARHNHHPSPKRPVNRRRKSVLRILEAQLVSGVKPVRKQIGVTIPLEVSDISRINKEIVRLKAKIIT
jgi:hypothetical protein